MVRRQRWPAVRKGEQGRLEMLGVECKLSRLRCWSVLLRVPHAGPKENERQGKMEVETFRLVKQVNSLEVLRLTPDPY